MPNLTQLSQNQKHKKHQKKFPMEIKQAYNHIQLTRVYNTGVYTAILLTQLQVV